MVTVATSPGVEPQQQNELAEARVQSPQVSPGTELPLREPAVALEQLYALETALRDLRNAAPDPEAIMANAPLLYEISAAPSRFPEAAPLAEQLIAQLNTHGANGVPWCDIFYVRGGINGEASPREQIAAAIERGILTGAHLTPDSLPTQLFQASISFSRLAEQLEIQPSDYEQYLRLRQGNADPAEIEQFLQNFSRLPSEQALVDSFPQR